MISISKDKLCFFFSKKKIIQFTHLTLHPRCVWHKPSNQTLTLMIFSKNVNKTWPAWSRTRSSKSVHRYVKSVSSPSASKDLSFVIKSAFSFSATTTKASTPSHTHTNPESFSCVNLIDPTKKNDRKSYPRHAISFEVSIPSCFDHR